MDKHLLLPELSALVKAYTGKAVTSCWSRGKQEWSDMHILLKLQSHVDAVDFVLDADVMEAISEAYVECTPFYKQLVNDVRELRILPSIVGRGQEVELLMEPSEEHADDGSEMAELESGLMVPWPQHLDFRVKRFCKTLERVLAYKVTSLAVSCVPDDWFVRRWVENVGGHGYAKRDTFIYCPGEGALLQDADATHVLFQRRALWEERKQNGCHLTETCVCARCQDDRDHTMCTIGPCIFKPQPARKRFKV